MSAVTQHLRFVVCLTGICVGWQSADATLITSVSDLTSPTIITFAPFANPNRVDGAGPVQIGLTEVGEDVVFTTTSSGTTNESFVGQTTGFGLGDNGQWTSDFGPFTGSSHDSPQMMVYSFNDGLVNGVGGFMNYKPDAGGSVFIEVLDSTLTVIESFDLTTFPGADITTGAANVGAFRGILRASNDIKAFRINAFDLTVLDDLSFSRLLSVPEPTTTALLMLGLLGASFARKRRDA